MTGRGSVLYMSFEYCYQVIFTMEKKNGHIDYVATIAFTKEEINYAKCKET